MNPKGLLATEAAMKARLIGEGSEAGKAWPGTKKGAAALAATPLIPKCLPAWAYQPQPRQKRSR